MAKTKVRIRISDSLIRKNVGPQLNRGVKQAAELTRGRVRESIQHQNRVDSARMRDTVATENVTKNPLLVRWRIFSPMPYTLYQELGTRAHGPVRAPALVFRMKGTAQIIRTKWVRGVTAGNFFKGALQKLRVEDFLK